MRTLTKECPIGTFTQGSIFYGLKTSKNKVKHGIVITARCDIAQNKIHNIVCLPIHTLRDWLDEEEASDIHKKARSKIDSQINPILSQSQISTRAISIYGLEATVAVLDEKKCKKQNIDKIKSLTPLIDKINTKEKIYKDSIKEIADPIIQNKDLRTYFIERITQKEKATGYVIDLREPISIQRSTLTELSKGLEYDKYLIDPDRYSNIKIKDGELAEFLSTLIPPYTEHLLQKFANFYTRIGTEDISHTDLLSIRESHEIN